MPVPALWVKLCTVTAGTPVESVWNSHRDSCTRHPCQRATSLHTPGTVRERWRITRASGVARAASEFTSDRFSISGRQVIASDLRTSAGASYETSDQPSGVHRTPTLSDDPPTRKMPGPSEIISGDCTEDKLARKSRPTFSASARGVQSQYRALASGSSFCDEPPWVLSGIARRGGCFWERSASVAQPG